MEQREMQEMLFNDLGEEMNKQFTKEQMRRFYGVLKKVHKMILWQNNVRHSYFVFEENVYIGSKKFRIVAANVARNIEGEYYEDDRVPVEVKVILPIENTLSGIKSDFVTLTSTDNRIGGMSYIDFIDFMKVYKGWMKSYRKSNYENYEEPVHEEKKAEKEDFPMLQDFPVAKNRHPVVKDSLQVYNLKED